MNRFTNKTVLVTGGSSGIGLAAAVAFAAEGATVVITGRDVVTLGQAQATIGSKAVALHNDASDIADAKLLAESLIARGLRLDAVFINAGVAKLVPFAEVDEMLWNQIISTNLKGPYFQIQALLPLLNPGSSIVLNGSVNAGIGMPNTSVYAASKAALISLARTLSAELLPSGVRVNVVSPGPVVTPLYKKLGLDTRELEATSEHIQSLVPLGRFGTSQEIAATVLHLSSQESAFIVGTEIIADGGMSKL
ncbi:SDR family oxidoreductase [Comamonas testosteroni]|uniref:SDR family oxidoreductase n=1 Tax=Comamonas testosteroni TaxID=285 RepID=UPI0025FE5A63|nr:SDR family oxidoreductase [Comamonas testosteroni]MEB5964731.1 SDR family oxidoreductase [Comamonas testosteroni]